MGVKLRRVKPRFHQYRYQIVPIDRHGQAANFEDHSTEELVARKNEFFWDAIQQIDVQLSGRSITSRIAAMSDPRAMLQLAVERDLKVGRRDFTEDVVENWPQIFVLFDNDPEVQTCFIEDRKQAFSSTKTVAQALEEAFGKLLFRYGLTVSFNPIYDEEYFWKLVDRHRGQVTRVEFTLVTPNMPSISRKVRQLMDNVGQATDAEVTKLALVSDPKGALFLDPENETLKTLVEYSSDGGGETKVKVRGLKLKSTSQGICDVSIDELNFEGFNVGETMRIFGGWIDPTDTDGPDA